MIHLVYASLTTKKLSDGELVEWVQEFRAKNGALGVTGMLLYQDGAILQALEGEAAVIDALFAKIRVDPRHHDVELLVRVSVPKRQFPNWSMGFQRFADEDLHFVPDPNDPDDELIALDQPSWKAAVALGLLARFNKQSLPAKV